MVRSYRHPGDEQARQEAVFPPYLVPQVPQPLPTREYALHGKPAARSFGHLLALGFGEAGGNIIG